MNTIFSSQTNATSSNRRNWKRQIYSTFWRPVDETDTSHQHAKTRILKSTPFYCHTATDLKAAASVSDTTVNSLDATYQKIFLAETGAGPAFTNVWLLEYKCTGCHLQCSANVVNGSSCILKRLLMTLSVNDSEKSVAMLARSTGFTDTRMTRSLT